MFDYPSVRIIFKEKRSNKVGEAPIYLQYIHRRKVNLISLKRSMPIKCWKGIPKEYFHESGPNRHPLAVQVNLYLRKMLLKANEIILNAQVNDKEIYFQEFKELFTGNNYALNFLSLSDRFINRRIGEGVTRSTIHSYHSKQNKVKAYDPKLTLRDISESWLHKYEAYLRLELKNNTNTIARDMQFIKSVCNFAIKQGLIDRDPFLNYQIKRHRVNPTSLTLEEVKMLQKLYNTEVLRLSLQKVLRMFLWSCYTGMDFQDVCNIKYKDIQKIDGNLVVNFVRLKTGIPYIVPLVNNAILLIDLTHPKDEHIFEKISNQKTNQYIKEVINIARIQKVVTFHKARHTFGTNSINAGIPREIVKKMMGHSKNEMTDHYARLRPSTIINTSLELWNKQ